MINPLYCRFIPSVCAGAPRGSFRPPASPRPWSPIPASRMTDRQADRPAPPPSDRRQDARHGVLPSRKPSKSPANAPLASVRRPLSQDCHKVKPLIDLSGGIRRDIRHGIRLFVRRSTNAQQVFRPATFPDTGARDPSVFARPPPPTATLILHAFAVCVLDCVSGIHTRTANENRWRRADRLTDGLT